VKRRAWIGAGVALAAAAGGAGLALRHNRRSGDDGASALWGMGFEQPDGGHLNMASLRGHPVLVNFWATWCPPCITEMPLLDQFQRDQRAAGWRVVGLAIDSAAPVREYLARRPMSFAIGLAGAEGIALTRSLGNAHGSLPFTVMFDRRALLVERKLGPVESADLQRWAAKLG